MLLFLALNIASAPIASINYPIKSRYSILKQLRNKLSTMHQK